jgi:hypothetical protein
MKKWATTVFALDPITWEYLEYSGPIVEAPTAHLAFEYCQNNGLGYCHVDGELIAEIPCDENMNPQWDKMTDYKLQDLN